MTIDPDPAGPDDGRLDAHPRLDAQLRFVIEADRLKGVRRQNTLIDDPRRENSAEHSWHLSLMALAFAEYAPPETDLSRVITMLIVHDLVEIDAGDTFVYDAAAVTTQAERERAAADRIFALLPRDQAGALRATWDEFEERRTPEARFARALDRLQPMLINFHTGGGTWLRHGITADRVLARVALIADGSPELGAYAAGLIEEAVRGGYLAPAANPDAVDPATVEPDATDPDAADPGKPDMPRSGR
jgi:putative hydrolase of HD superfamily